MLTLRAKTLKNRRVQAKFRSKKSSKLAYLLFFKNGFFVFVFHQPQNLIQSPLLSGRLIDHIIHHKL